MSESIPTLQGIFSSKLFHDLLILHGGSLRLVRTYKAGQTILQSLIGGRERTSKNNVIQAITKI